MRRHYSFALASATGLVAARPASDKPLACKKRRRGMDGFWDMGVLVERDNYVRWKSGLLLGLRFLQAALEKAAFAQVGGKSQRAFVAFRGCGEAGEAAQADRRERRAADDSCRDRRRLADASMTVNAAAGHRPWQALQPGLAGRPGEGCRWFSKSYRRRICGQSVASACSA